MNSFKELCDSLTEEIQKSYESGIGLEEAERLAGKFLNAQIQVANELRNADLDARMKRSGTKAIQAAVYLREATKGDKKPSDVLLNALVDQDKVAQDQRAAQDYAEVYRDYLENIMSVFREAHIHFRGIAKNGSYLA